MFGLNILYSLQTGSKENIIVDGLLIKSVKVTLDVVYVKCDSFIPSFIIIHQLYTYHVAGDQRR